MMTTFSDFLVIGGGIHGISCAFHLASSGHDVAVLEKNVVGRHASSVNAGGVRLLFRDFPEIPLALNAMEHWESLDQILGDDLAKPVKFKSGVGQIGISTNQSETDWCIARAKGMVARGYDHEEIIDRQELLKLIPEAGDRCIGGIISRRDGHASPANATHAFRVAATQKGARLFEHTSASNIDRQGDLWRIETNKGRFEAPFLINCAGAWSASIAAMIGDRLPIECEALSMMVTMRAPVRINPVVLGIDRPLSFKQSDVGSLVIGGGILAQPDIENDTSRPYPERMLESAKAVVDYFPSLKDIQVLRTWSGLEAHTPDHLPIISPGISADNVWHVCGFSGHGFQLAPEVGLRVAKSILNNSVEALLAPFTAERFQRRQLAQGTS